MMFAAKTGRNEEGAQRALSAMADSFSTIIWEIDENGRFIYLDPESMQGMRSAGELHISGWTRLIHPDDYRRVMARVREARAGGKSYRVEYRIMRSDGTSRWVLSNGAPRPAPDGSLSGYIGTINSLDEHYAMREELIRSETELRLREERFRSLTTLSSDWYWEIDADLRFTFLSEGIHTRLGIRPEEILGMTIDMTCEDCGDPGFIECVASMAARRPFRDQVYPVMHSTYPGVVRFIRMSGEPLFEDEIFRGYRGITRDVTHEVRNAQALRRLATVDTLTELPNRATLEMRLRQRITDRRGVMQGVMFIDLDGFKEVNDSLGHKAGDLLLRQIAQRFRASLRPDDIVARLGGDEFVVVAECAHGKPSAARIAEKLGDTLVQPFMLDGQEVKAGASIGISMYPQDGETCEVLLQNADTALYRAKADGRRGYCFFTADMGAASKVRLRLQTDLRHALARGEFHICYQPRVCLATLDITGMEALLRWSHPQLGLISPAQFIPLAEHTGMIGEIGAWVLRQAAAQAQEWMRRTGRTFRMAVNLSTRQLLDKRIVSEVANALAASGLPPGLLELELTESVLVEDPAMAEQVLKELKALGLYLSVDDFGTGYSSLAYLRRFPFDCVKLDRSFLLQRQADDVSPGKLIEAVISLAHALNMAVVAEGVETEEQLQFLRTTSCDEIQGFCISRPVPPEEFAGLFQGLACPLPRVVPHAG